MVLEDTPSFFHIFTSWEPQRNACMLRVFDSDSIKCVAFGYYTGAWLLDTTTGAWLLPVILLGFD